MSDDAAAASALHAADAALVRVESVESAEDQQRRRVAEHAARAEHKRAEISMETFLTMVEPDYQEWLQQQQQKP